MIEKLTNGNTWDNEYTDKLNDLIDLVNSQQEAMEKLEKLVGVGQDINPVLVVGDKPADDKQADKVITVKEGGIPTMPQPVDYKSPIKTVPAKDKHPDTRIEPFDYYPPRSATFRPDTHRTVTLRIPKGMRIGQAIFNAIPIENAVSGMDMIDWLASAPDTDLQKALDELGESNE